MNSSYAFKRNFYRDVEKAIGKSSVAFLLGPKGCGKTVCLKQLRDNFSYQNEFEEVVYIDAKNDLASADEKSSFIDGVTKSVYNNEKKLFLIDETTYLEQPDIAINCVEDSFTSLRNTNTKVVFAGNPSGALECWGHRAFAGDAVFIRPDLISYHEWLDFKGIAEVSEKTYKQFIFGIREFYTDFHSTQEYLQSCLDEAAVSNQRAAEMVLKNDCDGLTADKLLDILYAALGDKLSERCDNYQNMSAHELRQALKFLKDCGIIAVTYISSSFDTKPYVVQDLLSGARDFSKSEILNNLKISIKHPMFYVDILKNIFKDRLSEYPLESIAEAHIRGLLPDTGCFEYRDEQGNKIDYVRKNARKAIEFSLSDEKVSQHFDVLPGGFEKTLLTKNMQGRQGDIKCVPYYRFIFEMSENLRASLLF